MMDGNNSQYTIGAALAESGLVSYAWPRAIWEGWRLTALSLKILLLVLAIIKRTISWPQYGRSGGWSSGHCCFNRPD